MLTVDIQEAQSRLSELVERAAQGQSFIIAKSGKPLVKVTALEAAQPEQRFGFLAGEFQIPEDFDTLGEEEIEAQFEGR